jgi:hypothetical protein
MKTQWKGKLFVGILGQAPSGQRDWLDRNGWKYVLNAANRPIVGRYFVRLHLAGVSVAKMAPQEAWRPDFSKLKQGK